jgi:hypothetical protein
MTRRNFIWSAALGIGVRTEPKLAVPVHRVMDSRIQCTPEQFRRFWWSLWPEAVRDFKQGDIQLQSSDAVGEIRRSPGGRPIFVGLRRGVINLVLTDHIPMDWDNGRALAGITTLREGYCVCMIALSYAHGNQIPFLSVNTCVHEILHALLQDIFVDRPTWFQTSTRESRIDWYATRLGLFHDGAAIRKSAAGCLNRLRSAAVYSPTSSFTSRGAL